MLWNRSPSNNAAGRPGVPQIIATKSIHGALNAWFLWLALGYGALVPAAVRAQDVSLVAAGDIEWSRAVKPPAAYTWEPTLEAMIAVRDESAMRTWTDVPFLNRPAMRDSIAARIGREMVGRQIDGPGAHHRAAIIYPLAFNSLQEELRYPFQRLRSVIQEADVAFSNLEMPLSDRARHTGAFLGNPAFADALRWGGFDVVSTANNHAFDGEVRGLLDTIDALDRAGVGSVGSGIDLDEARKPHVIEVNGISIAFLAYTWSVNEVGSWGFANRALPGVMPLDPTLIKDDIRRIRDQVDYVAVSFHWAIENSKETHPEARAFAYDIIDAGADIILGHHPHVPRGVEVYNGRVIFYSLGNFVFGHGHTYWGDNYVARLRLTRDGRIMQVEILPIAGRGNDMSQPYLLSGARAQALLEEVQQLTASLDTRMEIADDVGVIRVLPPQAENGRDD